MVTFHKLFNNVFFYINNNNNNKSNETYFECFVFGTIFYIANKVKKKRRKQRKYCKLFDLSLIM